LKDQTSFSDDTFFIEIVEPVLTRVLARLPLGNAHDGGGGPAVAADVTAPLAVTTAMIVASARDVRLTRTLGATFTFDSHRIRGGTTVTDYFTMSLLNFGGVGSRSGARSPGQSVISTAWAVAIASALGPASSIGAASDAPSDQNLPARIVVLSGFQGDRPPPDAAISGSFKAAAGLFVTRKTQG
jgi:hypothetical protein